MTLPVAGGAKGDQVFRRVQTEVAAESLVVDFEVGHAAAVLAAPVVAFEDLEVETAVGFRIETAAWALGS